MQGAHITLRGDIPNLVFYLFNDRAKNRKTNPECCDLYAPKFYWRNQNNSNGILKNPRSNLCRFN